MADDPDVSVGNTDKQAARAEPTSSEHELGVDISDPDKSEIREQNRENRQKGDYSPDDFEDPELRRRVKEAREEAGLPTDEYLDEEEGGVKPADDSKVPPSEREDSEEGQQVRVANSDEGENPLETIARDHAEQEEQAKGDNAPAPDDGDDGLMDGVSDDDVEEAMDMELNEVDDIDPEHFDYEAQDFSSFGGYGDSTTIEYNDVYFLLEQPTDEKQDKIINEMMSAQDGMDMTGFMETLVTAVVARPANIEEITADWSPFEIMGLAVQCMEFAGLNSLGNM